ncbi:MAG TPA: terminase, partial [Nitrososphaerales archaeon]|nr:terminase [Nitrososphaerales archaeon]
MTDPLSHYKGNPNLKAAAVRHSYTKAEIKEFIKCSKDPTYFIQKYVNIVSIDEGLVPFTLYPFQKEMIDTFHENRFTICKLPRQSGKSTTILSYLIHYVIFNETVNVAILANKAATARDLLGRFQLAYEHLPGWLQQGVMNWNKGSLELENGSKILAASTSASAVRGGSYNIIFLDEFAFIPSNIAEQFFSSVYPTITAGQTSKVIIVSTPHGMNMFYKMWTDAVNDKSNFIPIEVAWQEVPGRDEAWKDETIRNTSEQQFLQEFECSFLGSIDTLISPTKIQTIPTSDPIESNAGLDVYEKPKKDAMYCISVDVARGGARDYSAFTVIDITTIPYKLVAKYKNNEVKPLLFPEVIYGVAKGYNEAYLLIEINDIGGQVADALHHDLMYENIIMCQTRGRLGQVVTGGFGDGTSDLGVRTTKSVKKIGCSNLKTLIESDKLLICDFDIVVEMSNFVQKGASFEADEGSSDDLMMCLVFFAWLTNQQYFKEITDED